MCSYFSDASRTFHDSLMETFVFCRMRLNHHHHMCGRRMSLPIFVCCDATRFALLFKLGCRYTHTHTTNTKTTGPIAERGLVVCATHSREWLFKFEFRMVTVIQHTVILQCVGWQSQNKKKRSTQAHWCNRHETTQQAKNGGWMERHRTIPAL